MKPFYILDDRGIIREIITTHITIQAENCQNSNIQIHDDTCARHYSDYTLHCLLSLFSTFLLYIVIEINGTKVTLALMNKTLSTSTGIIFNWSDKHSDIIVITFD